MSAVVTVDGKGIGHTEKDPDAVLDFPFEYKDWLVTGDTIATASFVDVVGVTVDSSSIVDDTSVTPTLTNAIVIPIVSGGVIGEAAQITCRIVTTQGRTYDRTLKFKIRAF